jgi:outer membrane lipoprotein-sorting protein
VLSLNQVKFRPFIAGIVIALSTSLVAQSTPAPAADAVARDLQRKYDRVTDFSADFVHAYRGGVLTAGHRTRPTAREEARQDALKYTAPEKKLFVSDGRKIYSYIPQDKQVVVGTMRATSRPLRLRCS